MAITITNLTHYIRIYGGLNTKEINIQKTNILDVIISNDETTIFIVTTGSSAETLQNSISILYTSVTSPVTTSIYQLRNLLLSYAVSALDLTTISGEAIPTIHAAFAATHAVPIAASYNATLPTYNDGDTTILHTDANGRLLVDTELVLNGTVITNVAIYATDIANPATKSYGLVDAQGHIQVDVLSTISGATSIGFESNAAVGVVAVQISANSHPCKYVVVTASLANTSYIATGGAGVTLAAGIILQPGFAVKLDISNSNLIYAIGAVAGPNTVSVQYFN